MSIFTRTARIALAVSAFTRFAHALDISICADYNTASGSSNTSNLQSNGLCSDYCRGSYVYAITSHENCWCSNYEPAKGNVVDNKDCNFPCLGYPFEFCGGKNKDTFGYLSLGPQPSGTKGSSDSGSSSSTSSSSSSPSSSSSSSTSSKPTSASSSVTSTVTVGGKVTTIIVMPTSVGDSSQENRPSPTSSSSSSGIAGGAIAGIVIGSIAAIALVGVLIWFLLRRRNQTTDNGEFRDDPSVRGSSRGRLGSHQQDLSIAGSAASPGSAGHRNSMLQADPRMDPFKQGLYSRQNGSAESINTLRDDHDYMRRIQQPKVLRATNPDPDS
ncbi:Cell wall integrity and stress response component 4 [Beauveria bassiana]|uniref:WSC domain-containing protein n=1 Tax=Beauveria bassiana (strain ARSEF 2860) TaxID=655819 RepID=J4KQF6_BEAB2|nr:WSC domain-containing protein [Beauveria bassiana ARSEF 2860]EJP69119.1 WSC domain-containing protein [Beauveria bassiana ARSEF 2860]KAF1738799.1 Cell wall integrity and stress response component 4 [Beauveria bassiana]KAH8720715.1 Cell wall integrity and stress response component 4 [Beauveria bassiana]